MSILTGLSLNAQVTNRDITTEINRELGTDSWKLQGRNLIVDYGSASAGRALWGIESVTYSVKYERRDK